MYAALVSVDVRIPGVRTRKEKRAVVKSLIQRLRNELNCSVAEVDHLDSYQRSGLGVAIATGSVAGATRVGDQVRRVVERDLRVEIITTTTVVVSDED